MAIFPADPDRLNYTESPWTNPEDGRKWIYKPHDSVPMWWPYSAPGTALTWAKIEALDDFPPDLGGGGATAFADLTDKATADLPAINGPLSTALDGKSSTSHTHALLDSATTAPTANTLAKRDVSGNIINLIDADNYVALGANGTIFGADTVFSWVIDPSLVPTGAQGMTYQLPYYDGTHGTVKFAVTQSATGVPDKLGGGTISGATTVAAGTTWTYGTGAAAEHATALGLGASDSPTFAGCSVSGNYLSLGVTSGIGWDNSNHLAIVHNGLARMVVLATGATIGNSMLFGFSSGTTPTNATRDTGISRKTSTPGTLRIGNGTANDASGTLELTHLTASGTVTAGTYTVATLPTGAAGKRCFVSDANATHAAGVGTTVAGGGANFVPVYHNGTNWIIG